jgi:Gpi18-like mannosyltransferase
LTISDFVWHIVGVIFASLGLLLIYFFTQRVFRSYRDSHIATILDFVKVRIQKKTLEKLRIFTSKPSSQAFLVILILAVSLLIRLLLFRIQGYYGDLDHFRNWYNFTAEKGLYSFYDSTQSDYPPFNVYIFFLFGKLAHALGPGSLNFITKLPSNLFDIATAYLIFRFVRQRYSFPFALGAMTVYAFNPATIFDLAVWGQMDSVYTFFMVASLFSVTRSKYELSAGLFSLAILTKPQSVVLLPVIAYLMLKNGGWKRVVTSAAIFFILIFLVIIPFHWDNPIKFIVDRYGGYNKYAATSLNAYNFWALLGFGKSDTMHHLGLSYQMLGIIAFLIFAAFVMWQFHRRPGNEATIYAVFLLMFGFFMLMTRMHERYLFPVFALLALSFSLRHTVWLYVGLTGTYLANLVYVMSMLNAGKYIPVGHWSLYVLLPINAIVFFYAIWSFWRMQRANKATEPPETPHVPPDPKLPEAVA